jgi:tRNA(Ile)-lysidine synthase
MEDIVLEVIRNICGLGDKDLIIVGVSGGPDSLSLVHVFHRLQLNILVAHLNHQLREKSDAEEEYVKGFVKKLGYEFVGGKTNVLEYGQIHKLAMEEAARELRYQFLFKVASEYGAMAVAVGHTADDQVETVLMHLLRGAGLSGLKGMTSVSINPAWSDEILLIRPMLDVWRTEVLDYCNLHQIQPVFDESNLDTTYFRNRMRHELVPYLEEYNPQIKRLVWKMADTLAGDHAVIEEVLTESLQLCESSKGKGWVGLDIDAFLEEPLGVQRGLLRKIINQLRPGLRDIDYATIERARKHIEEPSQLGIADLVSGLQLVIDQDKGFIAESGIKLPTDHWPQLMDTSSPLELAVPGKIQLESGWELSSQWVESPSLEEIRTNVDKLQVWVDGSEIKLPLLVRQREPGDRIYLLGMEGHTVKLSDLFINEKIPRRARRNWPLVLSGDQIIWVAGLRSSHHFRVGLDSKTVIKLEIKKLNHNV